MAINKPTGDDSRKGAVKKRSQMQTKIIGEAHATKRDKSTGRFMDVKADDRKFKGVRREQ